MTNFADILNTIPTSLSGRPEGYGADHISTNLDILFQKMSRTKFINNNKLLDFMALEQDKNFVRGANKEKLNNVISKLVVSSQLMNMVQTQIFIARLTPYFPESFRYAFKNLQGMLDSSANLLMNIRSLGSYQQIGMAFAADLLGEYTKGNVTFNNLLVISQNVTDYFIYGEPIDNNVIRSLLSLGLNQFFTEDIDTIFDTLQYVDTLYSIFGEDTYLDTYNNRLKELVGTYSKKKVSTAVTSSNYVGQTISINDPLGLDLQDTFHLELTNSFESYITSVMNTDSVLLAGNLTDDQKQEVISDLLVGYSDIIEKSSGPGKTLPSLLSVSKGVEVESFNTLGDYIKNSIQEVFTSIFNQLNIPSQTDIEPYDYLINIKRNIESRNKFKSTGVRNEKLQEIDRYFRTVFGRDYKESEIDQLYTTIQELLDD